MEEGGGGRWEAGLDFLLGLAGLSLSALKFASIFYSFFLFLFFSAGHFFISLADVRGS